MCGHFLLGFSSVAVQSDDATPRDEDPSHNVAALGQHVDDERVYLETRLLAARCRATSRRRAALLVETNRQ